MSAIGKFFQDKRSEWRFRKAGPGHKLAGDDDHDEPPPPPAQDDDDAAAAASSRRPPTEGASAQLHC